MNGVRDKAQEVLGEGEQLLDEANELSVNINKELEVHRWPYVAGSLIGSECSFLYSLTFILISKVSGSLFFCL